jgi:L-lactate dehydrogenase complex protein LldF
MRARFLRRVGGALEDSQLQQNLETNAEHMRDVYAQVFGQMEDLQEQREHAHQIRLDVVRNLEKMLGEFTDQLAQNGWQVHRARDAREACGHVIDIARRAGADMVVKSKSLLTEEIGLNEALKSAGIRPVETDLGEFIVQLRGEPPSHIIAPALHLNRRQVGETFRQELGMPASDDIATMTAAARSTLREFFLRAPIGISGVNFGVAESGLVCLLTNEGNGRMVTTLPRIHIAIMGAERLLRRAEELPLMLSLLSRGGAGQRLSTYQSLMRTPRREGDPEGPQARHIIVVDNGRIDLSRGDLSEILLCIRCGACLDVCPVYREIGGHSYGSVYPGPIGSVLSAGLFGVRRYGHLAKASTLCGACYDICPVKIDIPTLLLRVRHEYAGLVGQPAWMKWGLRLYAGLMGGAGGYRLGRRLAALAMRLIPKKQGWVTRLPVPFNAWTRYRDFPPFRPAFRDRWPLRVRHQQRDTTSRPGQAVQEPPLHPGPREEDVVGRFESVAQALGAEFHRCEEADLASKIDRALAEIGARSLLHWDGDSDPALAPILDHLGEKGYDLISPSIPEDGEARFETNQALSFAQAGLTCATAAFADTGTLVLSSGAGHSALASLLPPVHIAILRAELIHASMEDWIGKDGKQVLEDRSFTHFISGPSRTADIEMTLTIGVHGPGRLLIFCFGAP